MREGVLRILLILDYVLLLVCSLVLLVLVLVVLLCVKEKAVTNKHHFELGLLDFGLSNFRTLEAPDTGTNNWAARANVKT